MVLPAAVVGPTHMATAPLPAGMLALVALAAEVGEAEASGAESAPPGVAFPAPLPALLPALIPVMLVLVERRHGVATVVGTMGFDLNKDPLLTWILVAPSPADSDLVAEAEAPRAVAAAAAAAVAAVAAVAAPAAASAVEADMKTHLSLRRYTEERYPAVALAAAARSTASRAVRSAPADICLETGPHTAKLVERDAAAQLGCMAVAVRPGMA